MVFLYKFETHCTDTRHTKAHKYLQKETKKVKAVKTAELKANYLFAGRNAITKKKKKKAMTRHAKILITVL